MFVCAGLTLGTAAARSARTVTVGLLAVLSAPAAFLIAKVIHRAATQSLGLESSVGPSPLFVASVKAIEFGSLGLIAGWLSERAWAGITVHALVGLASGVVFGGTLIAYAIMTAAVVPPAAALAGVAVNELLYPAGCAVILFAAGAMGERLAVK